MTTDEAAQLRIGDVLDYPQGWPTGGCNLALKTPVTVIAIRKSSWSQTHVMLGLACANGKTTEADAGWFKTPQRINEPAKEDDPFAAFA